MAKVTMGLSDNLLLLLYVLGILVVILSLPRKKRWITVAATVNTARPITKTQLRVLEEDWGSGGEEEGWVEVLRPIERELACGDVGDEAMREWKDIVSVIEQQLDLDH